MPDRDALLALLRESAPVFTGSFRTLTPGQFHFRPAPGRWTIAETAEHVIVSEVGSVRLMRGRMLREPAPAEVLAATAGADERIERRLGQRDRAFAAPDIVLPTGRWSTPDEMVGVFEDARAAAMELVARTDLDLASHAAPHPVLGPLTGLQWAHFLVRHCLRHVEQIEETKAAEGYPTS